MSQIVEPKTYTGKELETIFFRPMLSGPDANELGIKIMYNMPVPTTFNLWQRGGDILQSYGTGWDGGTASRKYQKTIGLHKVKAEMGYSASDYFSMVFEQIAGRSDVNLEDLGGTELEEAETRIFKEAIAESIRVTMWCGNTSRSNGRYATFDGLLNKIMADIQSEEAQISNCVITGSEYTAANAGEAILKKVWDQATDELKQSKSDGQLAFFVSSDIYAKYEDVLDSATIEAAYISRQEGRESLSYRGIPVIDMRLTNYLPGLADLPNTFILLSDRRNLALAVNTSDFPGTEVRMWYNPDEMENRQRAVFMAGCDYLLPELVSFGYKF